MNIEKEKLEISKLIEENKRNEQENIRRKLELERQQLELKNKELIDMKQSLNDYSLKPSNQSSLERSNFNNNPIHFPLTRNVQQNFTFCVWFKTSQPNAGISGI